jgi:hypothetical protein
VLCRNYSHVAKLWKQEQRISQSAVAQARAHHVAYLVAYSVQRRDGLRLSSILTYVSAFFAGLHKADMTFFFFRIHLRVCWGTEPYVALHNL